MICPLFLQKRMKKRPVQFLAQGAVFESEFLVLALPCRLSLLLTLNTGLLVMLALANLGQNAGPGTLALETLESALKGFVFPNADFRHCFPSPRANRDTHNMGKLEYILL